MTPVRCAALGVADNRAFGDHVYSLGAGPSLPAGVEAALVPLGLDEEKPKHITPPTRSDAEEPYQCSSQQPTTSVGSGLRAVSFAGKLKQRATATRLRKLADIQQSMATGSLQRNEEGLSLNGLRSLHYDGHDAALLAAGSTAVAVALTLQPNLTHISLPRNELTDQGAWALASAVRHNDLRASCKNRLPGQ